MTNKICDGCETVAHCLKNGCVPKTTKQTQVRSTEEAPARSALKLALEALNSFPAKHLTPFISSARTAIREALAEPSEALASEASEESSGTEQPDRHELQKDGKHPAPCARFCEAAAFNIEIRGLRKRLTEQPAQRTWVGLTNSEWQAIVEDNSLDTIGAIKMAIEAKLKEKNSD